MTFANWRKFLTYMMVATVLASPVSSLINKALGGDGSHVHFDAISHDSADISLDTHHHDHGASQGLPVDADQQDHGQANHEGHFHFITMAFPASYNLTGSEPDASYSQHVKTAQLSRISTPPARPPRQLS